MFGTSTRTRLGVSVKRILPKDKPGLSRARHALIEALKVKPAATWAGRARQAWDQLWGKAVEPRLVANLKPDDIYIAFPTAFQQFQSDGYLDPAIVISVDSTEARDEVVQALQKNAGLFLPMPERGKPGQYYRFFETPVEFVIRNA
jgi:hypothetical protein